MEKLLVIVPARGGSKRLPGKNRRSLAGRSLLERTRDVMIDAGIETPCLLSTDDEEIAREGRRLGWLVPFLRPAELATDDVPTLPVIMHALDWFSRKGGGDPEAVMVLQVTSPFRGDKCLRVGLDILDDRREADAVIGVRPHEGTSEVVFRRGDDGYLAPFDGGPRQVPLYTPNGALYLVRTAALRRHRTLFPPRTLPLRMEGIQSLDIDTERDWRRAEEIIAEGLAR